MSLLEPVLVLFFTNDIDAGIVILVDRNYFTGSLFLDHNEIKIKMGPNQMYGEIKRYNDRCKTALEF